MNRVTRALRHWGTLAGKGLREARRGGRGAVRRELERRLRFGYGRWVRLFDTLTETDRAAIRARTERLPRRPVISVIVPVYEIEERFLRAAIESVRRQLYPDWELCLADDASPSPHVRRVLEEYAALDPKRIRVVFRERNGHIVEASNTALALATGEYVAFLDHDDELAEHALYRVAEEIAAHPNAVFIYSDEDKLDRRGRRREPLFKPDWDPELMRSMNATNHLSVYRTDRVRELGGLRKGFEGSQDYDLALRVGESAPAGTIRHIPEVLYHWRMIPGSTALEAGAKGYAFVAAQRALREHLDRLGERGARVEPGFGGYHRVSYPVPEPAPLVSVIIPTRDQVGLLRQTVEGVLRDTDYPRVEVLVVDNQSSEPEALAYLERVAEDSRVRVLPYDAPFNFSAINNFAARAARGEILALLNNDLRIFEPGWLRELVGFAVRPEIGVVGAQLYYDNDSVQHAGVVLGIGGVAGHVHKHFSRERGGYMGRLRVVQGFSAVTAACFAVRRSVYEEVGGLDETNLKVAFNDVDFCLRVRERGYRNVFTPYARLYHLESASRGSDAHGPNARRFAGEYAWMKRRWAGLLAADPAYNPNLTVTREDFSLAFPPRARKPWKS